MIVLFSIPLYLYTFIPLYLYNIAYNELIKVKNKAESTLVFSEMSILNKAMNLAYCELLGDANMVNQVSDKYLAVTKEQIQTLANIYFTEKNSCTLYYKGIKV